MATAPSASQIFKFCFIARLHNVTLALKFPCVVSVIWKRGEKACEVKERRQITNGVVKFDQDLQLECNMGFDPKTKVFEEKKTRFTVLIFSEKGNKQAGQVNLDVAQLLNTKSTSLDFTLPLEKCPDKNAKLSLTLKGYMKEEISEDAVSKKSTKTYDMEGIINGGVVGDFKKKKEVKEDDKEKAHHQNQNTPPAVIAKKQQQSSRQETKLALPLGNLPAISKQNAYKLKLQEEYKQLGGELAELNSLALEQQTLALRYKEASSKAVSYYNKKLQQTKKQLSDMKEKAKQVESMIRKKTDLEKEMCECKEKMGRILNYAILKGDETLVQEIYNIYQQ